MKAQVSLPFQKEYTEVQYEISEEAIKDCKEMYGESKLRHLLVNNKNAQNSENSFTESDNKKPQNQGNVFLTTFDAAVWRFFRKRQKYWSVVLGATLGLQTFERQILAHEFTYSGNGIILWLTLAALGSLSIALSTSYCFVHIAPDDERENYELLKGLGRFFLFCLIAVLCIAFGLALQYGFCIHPYLLNHARSEEIGTLPSIFENLKDSLWNFLFALCLLGCVLLAEKRYRIGFGLVLGFILLFIAGLGTLAYQFFQLGGSAWKVHVVLQPTIWLVCSSLLLGVVWVRIRWKSYLNEIG